MFSHRLNRLAAGLLLAGGVPLAHAAGFALIEQNASGLGNAYAGAAAVAGDASTIFFNPAGMTLLPDRQAVVAGNLIKLKTRFSGTVSPPIGGGQGGDAGGVSFVPNAYVAYRVSPDIHLGLGVNVPFGLKTEYGADWIGRTQAIKSDLKTVNVNPSIAFRVSDGVSLGAGVNLQYLETELTNFAGPAGLAAMKGDDYGWGFNLGVLWQVTPSTRLGVSYRSEVDFDLEGSASFSALPVLDGSITAKATMPDSASLSLFHKLSPTWDLLADVSWTGWSDFKELAVYRTSGALLSYTPEHWEDAFRYALGATWHMSEKLSLRGGLAYDEAPVRDAYRTPRIPDGHRTWIAIGGQYRVGKSSAIDFGYAHLFVTDPSLQITANGTTLTGAYDNAVDLLSAQYTLSF